MVSVGGGTMSLKIKKRGEDGYRVISLRIEEPILEQVDRIAADTGHSRNELINIILAYGLQEIEIE